MCEYHSRIRPPVLVMNNSFYFFSCILTEKRSCMNYTVTQVTQQLRACAVAVCTVYS